MKAGYTMVAFCSLLSVVSQLFAQQEPQQPQQAQETGRKPREIHSIPVNLCQMADQIDKGGAVAGPTARKLEIETKDSQIKQMPDHVDISLSLHHRDEAVFRCTRGFKNYPFRIDSFVKAKISANGENISPTAPDAPFSPPVLNHLALKSSSQRHTGIPLAAAVHQRYKFTFTVFKNAADPTGKQFDPHLIVTP